MDINSFVIGYKKGKASGGGGSMEGFHMVRFFNDDQTTLLYTVFVPHGTGAIYAGETPASAVDQSMIFSGFDPSAEEVTSDLDCYAQYVQGFTSLDTASWETISALSASGQAENYFAVGETKMIHISGTVGTIALDGEYAVYILGFDHNSAIEGKGITFGTFKSALSGGKDIAFDDGVYYKVDGTKVFSPNHWNSAGYNNFWASSDIRYDILGSTDVPPKNYGSVAQRKEGYDPTENCVSNPVAGSLMAALPADLRAVLKPITKYTHNATTQQSSISESDVTATIDYLPLLSEYEVFGVISYSSRYEKSKQKQYPYFAAGNPRIKYSSKSGSADEWWLRSVATTADRCWCYINSNGTLANSTCQYSRPIAPIFKV